MGIPGTRSSYIISPVTRTWDNNKNYNSITGMSEILKGVFSLGIED